MLMKTQGEQVVEESVKRYCSFFSSFSCWYFCYSYEDNIPFPVGTDIGMLLYQSDPVL